VYKPVSKFSSLFRVKSPLCIFLMTILLTACGGSSSGMGSQAVPPAQGVRVLGLDVNGPPANYATSYAQAMTLGAR